MIRDKSWLTNEIEIMGSETSENYPHEQMVDREVVLNLIDQLDEPEVLTQEWIDEHRRYAGEMIYEETVVRARDLIKLLVPKQELPVIPQFVADFIEKWKNEYLTMSEWFNFNYDDDEEHEVFKWLYDNDYEENTRREYLLINAIRYGYEVEKEQLYYVFDKQGKTLLMLMSGEVCTSGGYALSESTFTKDIYQLTEKQIKDYDQRFWSFAVEVTE